MKLNSRQHLIYSDIRVYFTAWHNDSNHVFCFLFLYLNSKYSCDIKDPAIIEENITEKFRNKSGSLPETAI